ncbi:MAG: hypothetical protein K2F83_07770 [Oscillospiraceae bacterium]|nr:hypothetical protein [Oscillospiraceae bacterium]
METFLLELEKLYQQARELLEARPDAEQVIVALTAGKKLYCIANRAVTSGNTEDEDAFVKTLRESGDTRLLSMACVWRTGLALDVPSMGLRKVLLELDPANRETELLLQAGDGYHVRTMEMTMPVKKA